MMLFDANA